MTTRRQLMQGAAASMLGLTHLPNFAQSRLENLRIIVGFPPGGTTDAFARRIARETAWHLCQQRHRGQQTRCRWTDWRHHAQVRSGRWGPHPVFAGFHADNLPAFVHPAELRPIRCDPLGIGHSTDHAFVVGPAVPESVKNIKDFVEWAKANPGKASIGNPAAGSMPHLLAGRLAMLGGFQITNVPFAGSGPAIPQVMGGQLAGMSSPLGDWVQHQKAGKIRILATSGPDRAVFTPDVPTYREQGFGELLVREWFGFFAPAGVSEAVRQNLNSALRLAMNQQDIRDFVTPLAANLEASTTAEHTRRLADDSEMARRLVTALGFKADS